MRIHSGKNIIFGKNQNIMKKILLAVTCFILSISLAAQENEKPEMYKVGKYEVYILTEGSGYGGTDILIDAPDSILEKYVPDGTFPIATNAVLVRDGDKAWLIDTGYGRRIFEKMAALGVEPEKVEHVLLTHMHGDHIGGMLRDGQKAFPNSSVVVSQREYDYWTGDDEMNKLPEGRRGNFMSARKVIEEYENKLVIFDYKLIRGISESELSEGLTMIGAYGHTPGHIMFMLKDGDEQLLIWGDLTHALAVQMPHPEISVTYDLDPDMARISRLEVLEYVSANKIAVTGMHLPAPKIGMVVKKEGSAGGYDFVPLDLRK